MPAFQIKRNTRSSSPAGAVGPVHHFSASAQLKAQKPSTPLPASALDEPFGGAFLLIGVEGEDTPSGSAP